jgi:NADPH-dependent curcumin reductase CurA
MKDKLGFDKVINYKTQDVQQEIASFAPQGITGYFDNVGGPVTDAVLMNARNNAGFAICGSIPRPLLLCSTCTCSLWT